MFACWGLDGVRGRFSLDCGLELPSLEAEAALPEAKLESLFGRFHSMGTWHMTNPCYNFY